MTPLEAMKQALEALEFACNNWIGPMSSADMRQARNHLADAIAEMEKQEPVGHVVEWIDNSLIHGWLGDPPPSGTPLYTHPQLKDKP